MGRVVGPLYVAVGIGFVSLAYLCAKQRLRRNGLVGMRTRATMASDAAWYAAHRASAWSVAVAAVIFLAVGAWLLAADPPEGAARITVTRSSSAILLVVVIGGIQADRVAKAVLRSR